MTINFSILESVPTLCSICVQYKKVINKCWESILTFPSPWRTKFVDQVYLQNKLRSLGFGKAMVLWNCDIHPCLCGAHVWTSVLVGHGLTLSEIVEYKIKRNKEWKRGYGFMFLSTRTNKFKKKKTTKNWKTIKFQMVEQNFIIGK